jgi:hypothetical protein
MIFRDEKLMDLSCQAFAWAQGLENGIHQRW